MKIKILLFAKLKELAGTDCVEITLPGEATAHDAFRALCGKNPAMTPMEKSLLFAVNQCYVRPGAVLKENDELVLIPPVAGG